MHIHKPTHIEQHMYLHTYQVCACINNDTISQSIKKNPFSNKNMNVTLIDMEILTLIME